MAIDYGELSKRAPSEMAPFDKLPLVGKPDKTYEIETIEEKNHPKLNIKHEGNDWGFYLSAKLKNGKILPINSPSTYYLFVGHAVNDGDKIVVSHPAKGKWDLKKI